MAVEQNPYVTKITLVADSSGASGTSTKVNLQSQFTFVKLATASASSINASGSVATAITATADRPIGILQNAPSVWFNAAGIAEGVSEAEVTIAGVTKVKAGGNIAVGNTIGVSSTGLALNLAPVSGSAYAQLTKYIVGTALSAGSSGDVITVAIDCSNAVLAA